MKVAIYTRVSTEDQVERDTISIQKELLRKECEKNEWEIYDEYADDGISGNTALQKRPEGRRLLQDASLGRFEAIFVYRIDRLARNTLHAIGAVEELKKLGVAFISHNEKFDTSTSTGQLSFEMMASFASFERRLIHERTESGRQRRANEGKWCGGPPPYGFVVVDGMLVEDQEKIPTMGKSRADVVRWIFEYIAFEQGTLLGACRYLNALGVPTRYNNEFGHSNNTKWTASSVYNILINPAYKGICVYGRRSKAETAITEQSCPALVSPETWGRAHKQMRDNKQMSCSNRKRQYFLTGLIQCKCGYHFSGHPRKNKVGKFYFYYICNRQRRAGDWPEAPRCCAPSLPADKLEQYVWNQVCWMAEHPKEVRNLIKKQRQSNTDCLSKWAEEIETIKARIRSKDEDKTRVMEAYEAKVYTLAILKERCAAIDSQVREWENTLIALEDKFKNADLDEKELDDIETTLVETRSRIKVAGYEERREICRRWVRSINVVYSSAPPSEGVFVIGEAPDGRRRMGRPAKEGWAYIDWKFQRGEECANYSLVHRSEVRTLLQTFLWAA